MTTLVLEDTRWVLTVKLALVFPACTVTLDGTVATDVLLLESVTTAPPEGAAAVRVTVPVDLFPPLTMVGFRVSEESVTVAGGVMVREACTELLPRVAVITAVVVVVTDVVVTVNEAVVAPAVTVTLPGTLAEELLLAKLTTVPPAGAALLKVTVPRDALPPRTLLGFNVSEETVTVDAGVMVMEAWAVLLPRAAVITTAVLLRTPDLVRTVKVALVAPAGTVTLAGTRANELLLLNPTTTPPDGAAALRVTVP